MPVHLDSLTWSKSTIATLFKVGVACVVVGSVSGTAVGVWAVADGAVAFGGPQVVTIDPGPVAGALVGLAIASTLTITGTAATIVSWVAALINTVRLQDKAWFVALLALGVLSLGWAAMVAYLVAGPDSTATTSPAAA
jgi:hypothetical protein